MKNKGIVISVLFAICVVAGFTYMFIDLKVGTGNNLFFNKKKEDKPSSLDFNVEDNKDKDNTPSVVVSDQSILKLADNKSLQIDDSLLKDISDIDYLPGTVEFIGIKIVDGELYLYSNNYTSKIISLSEKAIALKKSTNGCDVASGDVLILTEYGNLYIIPSNTSGRFNSEVYNNLKMSNDINLSMIKLNTAGSKILAFTTYLNDGRGMTCGKPTSPLYTSGGIKAYDYNGLISYKVIKDYVGNGENASGLNKGFIIYSDNTISVDGVEKLKGSSGKNLKISEYYYGTDEKIYIVDAYKVLYTLSVKGNLKSKSGTIQSIDKVSNGTVNINYKKSVVTIDYKQSWSEGFVSN